MHLSFNSSVHIFTHSTPSFSTPAFSAPPSSKYRCGYPAGHPNYCSWKHPWLNQPTDALGDPLDHRIHSFSCSYCHWHSKQRFFLYSTMSILLSVSTVHYREPTTPSCSTHKVSNFHYHYRPVIKGHNKLNERFSVKDAMIRYDAMR